MRIALAPVGVLLILIATIDPLWTTLWIDGHGGPLTRRFNSLTRRVVLQLCERNHRLLSLTGPIVLFSTVVFWAVLLWAGWFCVFTADPSSLLRTQTGTPAGIADRIYYTGYALFTLGNGDFTPNGGLWEIATAVSSLSGLFMLTLSVTYLLAVIEAVVAKRSFASQVWTLGRTAEDILMHAWDGRGFPLLELSIVSITEQLNLVTEQHEAYPMLHFYHERRTQESVAANLAVFDDALTMLGWGVDHRAKIAPSVVHSARQTVSQYLGTLNEAFITPSDEQPPGPDLDRLRAAGIPTVDDSSFAAALVALGERRRMLNGFLKSERRPWPAMPRDRGAFNSSNADSS